jgi:release factor H-coupled RctB family protein
MLQVVERIEDVSLASAVGLDSKDVYLCVHSGSRGYGESILKTHSIAAGSEGIPVVSLYLVNYLLFLTASGNRTSLHAPIWQ